MKAKKKRQADEEVGRSCKVIGQTILAHFILETSKGVLENSADPGQMPYNVASDLDLHYL